MQENVEFINGYVLHDVIIFALRYALPRHTYAVEEICGFITHNMDKFMNERVQSVMLRDIEEILDSDYELHECDKRCIINLRWRLLEWNNKK